MLILLLLSQLVIPSRPLPDVTPGELATDSHKQPLTLAYICSVKWGLDDRHVTERMKRNVAKAYGIAWADRNKYEFDHLVPRSIGGADSERNLWPQLWGDAHIKDALEVRLSKLVCSGAVSLRTAQREMRTDWVYAAERWPRKLPK